MRPPPQGPFRHPLTTIFRTEASVRLLRELLRHGGALESSRLVRATGLTRQTVLSVLQHLEDVAVVQPVGAGRYRSFQVNQRHPLAPAIQQLFDAEANRVERVYEAIRRAAADVGSDMRAVWLYGSVARGEDTSTSDVDIAVAVGGIDSIEKVLDQFRERLTSMERAEGLSAAVVGVSDDDVRRLSKGDAWWVAMTRDAIPLVGADPRSYAGRLASGAKPQPAVRAKKKSRSGARS